MPNLASALRAEIRSAAGHQLARALAPLRRIERDLRQLVAIARRRRSAPAGGPAPRAGRGGRQAAVPTIKPSEVRAMRRRFQMNRPQFGRLAGVSTWTVFMWEHGKVVPSAESVSRLREIGKLSPAAAVAAAARPRKRRGPGRPRRRA
jgi:DNA-binding XRE family transcriptional regulator